MLSNDWKKKILSEQARESARLGRMDEVRHILLQLQYLDPDNEEILAELDRLQRGVRLKMVTEQENKLLASTLHAEMRAQGPQPESAAGKGKGEAQDAPKRIRKAIVVEDARGRSIEPEPAPIRAESRSIKIKAIAAHAPIKSDAELARLSVIKLLMQHEADAELLHHTKRGKVRRQQRLLDKAIKYGRECLSIQERQSIAKLQERIAEDLKRRSRDKNIIIAICSSLIVLVILGLFATSLLTSAKRADISLQLALVNENRAELIEQMETAQRPLYRLLYPKLKQSMQQAEAWLNNLHQGQEIIEQIETGKRDILTLTSEDYRALHRLADAKDAHSVELIHRLDNFKRERLSKEEQARVQVLEDIVESIPHASRLSHDTEKDAEVLKAEAAGINAAMEQFYLSQQIHRQSPEYMQASQNRLLEIKQYLTNIEQYKQVLIELEACTTYQRYLQLVARLKNASYKPAQCLYALSEDLPELSQINEMMRYNDRNEASDIMLKAERSFLGEQTTFSSDNPATATQVDAMESIFNTRALSTPLYQLISQLDGKVWISESAPTADVDGNLRLTRSKLDPMAILDADKSIYIAKKIGLILNYFNCSGLIKDCKMTREDFFRSVKILDTLSYVLQYQEESCPALAQGFIYQQLIKLVELHPEQALMGLSFSEELRSDIASFKELCDSNRISINGDEWLIPNPANAKAELLLRDWFNSHRQHNYSTDCKRTLRALLFAQVHYAGYVSEQGKAVVHSRLDSKASIWYLDDETKELTLGRLSDVSRAAPFSPLLYSSKN